MLYMEIQRSKHIMRQQKYYKEHRVTTACILRMFDDTNHCGQPTETDPIFNQPAYYGEGGTRMTNV